MALDIAVAHDHYYRWGGGEYVATELGLTFDAPVYTSFAHRQALKQTPGDLDLHELIDGHPLEGVFRKHLQDSGWKRTAFYMFLWELAPKLRDYDVILQSGNNPNWYVPEEDQTVVKYTHSPPRQAYDLFGAKGQTLDEAPWRAPFKATETAWGRCMKKATRQLWEPTTSYPTLWVANSDVVAKRIRKYHGVSDDRITVVYPPVDVEPYEPSAGGDYYLSLGRLSYHKNTDTIVRAFRDLGPDYPLKIAGTGPRESKLRELADGCDHIDFCGFVTEERKRELLERAKATVFMADNEDFGIVPVESMAAGTPVIGPDAGFTSYQISDGDNGVFARQKPQALADAVQTVEADGVAWDARMIHEFATQFGLDRFREEMQAAVDVATEMDRRDPSLTYEPRREVPADD